MKRITYRETEERVEAIDALVEDGVFHSRSEAIRSAIQELVHKHSEESETIATDGGQMIERPTDTVSKDDVLFELSIVHHVEGVDWPSANRLADGLGVSKEEVQEALLDLHSDGRVRSAPFDEDPIGPWWLPVPSRDVDESEVGWVPRHPHYAAEKTNRTLSEVLEVVEEEDDVISVNKRLGSTFGGTKTALWSLGLRDQNGQLHDRDVLERRIDILRDAFLTEGGENDE